MRSMALCGACLTWLTFAGYVLAIATCDNRRTEQDAGAEADGLRAQGQIVAAPVDDAELVRRVLDLERDNAELAAALAHARRVAPRSRPVAVVEASTGPVEVIVAQPSEPLCLLSPGDTAEIRVSEVVLRTEAGNSIVVGHASALRLEPGPETLLASGAFSATVTEAAVAPLPVPSWRWGGAMFGSASGLGLGAVAVSPPRRVLWLELELVAGAGLGAGGVSGFVGVVGRSAE